jgi:hypothetical protein
MRYFKNSSTNEVFGYDETDLTQIPFMEMQLNSEPHEEITGNWPLPQEEYIAPTPTLAELQAQLATLTAQINALAGVK